MNDKALTSMEKKVETETLPHYEMLNPTDSITANKLLNELYAKGYRVSKMTGTFYGESSEIKDSVWILMERNDE